MKTLKLFFKLFLIFVAFYIFSEIVSAEYIKNTYSSIDKIDIINQTPKIEIEESRATKVDGYIKGKVINTNNEDTTNKYIKVDCYSKYNNYLGSEYAKIGALENGANKNFKLKYSFEDVENIKVSVINEGPANKDIHMSFKELTNVEKAALIIGGLIVIYYMPVRYLFGVFPV